MGICAVLAFKNSLYDLTKILECPLKKAGIYFTKISRFRNYRTLITNISSVIIAYNEQERLNDGEDKYKSRWDIPLFI